jgi:hypothetical protein
MTDSTSHPVGPFHSIAHCPVCGSGLCGIRICTGDDPTESIPGRGFVMCDECEAVWMEPDISGEHLYADPENPVCPICRGGLWRNSRWADQSDVNELGWDQAVDPDLDQTK